MGDIVNLINTVGFPIGACIYLAVVQKRTIERLTEVVDNNTRALTDLLLSKKGMDDET